MSETIYVEFDGAQVLASIQRAIAACGSPDRVLGNIGEALVNSTKDRFGTESSPAGVPWPALSPRYARVKERKYPGKSILRREDRLFDSIVAQVHGDTLLVGTNASNRGYPYPQAMQLGAPARNVPPRPFLGVSPDDEQKIAQIVLDYLRDAIDGQS